MTPTLRTAILDALMERWRQRMTQDWPTSLESSAREGFSSCLDMILPVAEPMIREVTLREAATPIVCGACGQPWTGEKCGQSENGWEFPVCYPHQDALGEMISDERIERPARAIAAYDTRCRDSSSCIHARTTTRGNRCLCYHDAIAALTADAPEIAAAEIRGLETAREALEPFARAISAVENYDPLAPDEMAALRASFDYWTRQLGMNNDEVVTRDSVRVSDLRRARVVLAAIDARIAELKAKTDSAKPTGEMP